MYNFLKDYYHEHLFSWASVELCCFVVFSQHDYFKHVALSLEMTLLQRSEIFTWNYFQNQLEALKKISLITSWTQLVFCLETDCSLSSHFVDLNSSWLSKKQIQFWKVKIWLWEHPKGYVRGKVKNILNNVSVIALQHSKMTVWNIRI